MTVQHDFEVTLNWSDATGTDSFSGFTRNHEVDGEHKLAAIAASAPEWLRGDKSRYSSGDLFLAAIASSHMLRFLEVASQVGLAVVAYDDDVVGNADLGSRGDGRIVDVTLRPRLTVQPGVHATEAEVARLHERAQSMSIISRSVSVEIRVEPGTLTILDDVA
ncbi:OsmC family protein [Xylanimonas cellulosilytica DSM 15894]|uniref:OsmC family protein n=1 Tax=Xylanimonas cellulosilytica (strain DSM 15894 / JCM 12276 / CECT 5975 / KCTC 9989 / LMG 20990 / NBRC 107835 / XIL07) TaxID=446471 RepID=D1BS81_XYLCX|nr:OsmC family protein [Xylanimonas cellulosilytica]ACZ30573.1 OsmC family protein [Xylanimonas cellulosilytica DSM 15894]